MRFGFHLFSFYTFIVYFTNAQRSVIGFRPGPWHNLYYCSYSVMRHWEYQKTKGEIICFWLCFWWGFTFFHPFNINRWLTKTSELSSDRNLCERMRGQWLHFTLAAWKCHCLWQLLLFFVISKIKICPPLTGNLLSQETELQKFKPIWIGFNVLQSDMLRGNLTSVQYRQGWHR